MVLEKLCLMWFFLQVQSIHRDSSRIMYTMEGSTINLSFKEFNPMISFISFRNEFLWRDVRSLETDKYDTRLRPNFIDFQILNVTTNDTGFYWIGLTPLSTHLNNKTNTSCLSRAPYYKCAINGSSAVITFTIEVPFFYTPIEKWDIWRYKHTILRYFIFDVDFYIYNVTLGDEGNYRFNDMFDLIKLQVSKLWFINQTHMKTIVGQEGEAIEIVCSSDTEQYITALTLESNGTIKAIGDNQTVSYSFTPDRSDHLTKYQCVDSKHSSIMVEVELSITYAPAVTVRYTNGTIKCDCDGVPPIYSMYRLDRISKYGELVSSVNLDNETFVFKTDQFPYQRNGRYMCVVSNGIPGTNGKILQNSSIHVNYKGQPVFAKENRRVKIGKVGQSSIKMSFLVYSCPDVEEIFLQKLGRMRGRKRKMQNYVSKSTLLYNDLDNTTGVPGYDILIEINELDVDDFQSYIITVENRLGASAFQFEIIKKENPPLVKSKRTNFMILGIIGIFLFVNMIIIHICIYVKHRQNRDQRHHNVGEDHNYHTYDEIGSVSYRAVRPMRSSDTNDNQHQNQPEQLGAGISIELNRQSTIDNTIELNTEVSDVGLQQSDTTDDQIQSIPIAVDDRNVVTTHLSHEQSTNLPSIEHILIRETPSDQHRQSSNDSDSESSQTVMVGNAGDGYENPYQTVFQDHPESHQYNQATRERNNSISTADVNTTVIPSMQNIVNRNQTNESTSKESSSDEQSQISDDSDSGPFIDGMVGNLGEGYENPCQMILKDRAGSHPYARIMRARENSNSSTESDKNEEQQIGTGSTKKEEYINLKL